MNQEIYSILEDMKKHTPRSTIATSDRQTDLLMKNATLLVLLAEENEKSSIRIEKLTKTLTGLTWVIAILTAFLVLSVFFEFPKKGIQPNQNPSLRIEQPQKDHDGSKVQKLPKDSKAIPNVGK
jgi:hypothetical protein